MRAAKRCLTAVFGVLALMSIGTSEASAQRTFVRVCNNSGIHAWVALTAHPSPGDSRFLISGWYEVPGRGCKDLQYVGRGWIYFYAESDDERTWWSGNAQRFCVQYPGPFDRYISDDFKCGGDLLKSFFGYYADDSTFVWEMD
jgi:uncharacterized membrane protein